MSSLVVRSSDGLEALLASSVPNLKFDFLSINIDSFDLKINTNSGHEVISEHIVSETDKQGRFTNTWWSNKQNFEEVIAKEMLENKGVTYYSDCIFVI